MEFKSCPLTGWKIVICQEQDYYTFFIVKNKNNEYKYLISRYLLEDADLSKTQHVFRWIFFNGLFSHNIETLLFQKNSEKYGIDEKVYKNYIENYSLISPKEKMDHFLVSLYDLCNDSYSIRNNINGYILNSAFKDRKEFEIYRKELVKRDFINYEILADPSDIKIDFTFNGLFEVSKLKESGKHSKRCFVAMSFDPSLKETREAIRIGIKEAGYDAIFIDEVYPDSDQTINDAIIAEIKRSKFLVADFTQQKKGVYFEAGYALGRGLKVIYCCDEEDFKKNSHFDLKPFSHILYNSTEELQKRLKYKIEAWIE